MLKFISLGSSSSGNSYLLKDDEGCLLIDAGVGPRTSKKYFKEFGIRLDEIKAVFVTHDHADHIKAVPMYANELKIPIYTTQLVHQGITRNHSITAKICPESVRVMHKGATVQVGAFSITSFGVPHDSLDCVGYRVTHGDITFGLLTDVGHITDEIEETVGLANYLVLEANYDEDMLKMGSYSAYLKGRIRSGQGHLSNKTTAKLLVRCANPHLRHVWLCHLSEENNHPELARKTVETILRSNGIAPGVDFQLDVLKRKSYSEIFELT